MVFEGHDIPNRYGSAGVVSARLTALMAEYHVSQGRLARQLGVRPPGVARGLKAPRRPSYEDLCRLADLFDVTTDHLLGRGGQHACLSAT